MQRGWVQQSRDRTRAWAGRPRGGGSSGRRRHGHQRIISSRHGNAARGSRIRPLTPCSRHLSMHLEPENPAQGLFKFSHQAIRADVPAARAPPAMRHPHPPSLCAAGRSSWSEYRARHALAATGFEAIRDLPATEAPPERRVAVPVTEATQSDASRSCRLCEAGRPAHRRRRRRRRRRCCARWRRSTRAPPASPPTPTTSSRSGGGAATHAIFTLERQIALLRTGAVD